MSDTAQDEPYFKERSVIRFMAALENIVFNKEGKLTPGIFGEGSDALFSVEDAERYNLIEMGRDDDGTLSIAAKPKDRVMETLKALCTHVSRNDSGGIASNEVYDKVCDYMRRHQIYDARLERTRPYVITKDLQAYFAPPATHAADVHIRAAETYRGLYPTSLPDYRATRPDIAASTESHPAAAGETPALDGATNDTGTRAGFTARMRGPNATGSAVSLEALAETKRAGRDGGPG